MDAIRAILNETPKVKEIKHITGRNAGSFKFVQLDIVLDTDSLKEAHEIAHDIEKKIKKEMPFVEKVVVHYE